MRAAPLLVAWHDDNTPIYSAHFEPHGKGRLATAGGDMHIRVSVGGSQIRNCKLTRGKLWKVEASGEERKVTYLSTLKKHTQAVNVVRWCPRGKHRRAIA